MRRRTVGIVLALFASSALAHGGGSHAQGTVKSMSAERLVVETKAGAKEFKLTPRTEYVKDEVIVTAKDVHPGDRVVVHGNESDGVPEATQVRAGGGATHGHGK